MINQLQGLAWGVITLAIIIGLGAVVIERFSTNVADCGTGFSYQTNGTATYTTGYCCNATAINCTDANAQSPSTASTNLNYFNTQLGSTGGGLATWIPIVIVLVIAVFFLSYFLGNKFGRSV